MSFLNLDTTAKKLGAALVVATAAAVIYSRLSGAPKITQEADKIAQAALTQNNLRQESVDPQKLAQKMIGIHGDLSKALANSNRKSEEGPASVIGQQPQDTSNNASSSVGLPQTKKQELDELRNQIDSNTAQLEAIVGKLSNTLEAAKKEDEKQQPTPPASQKAQPAAKPVVEKKIGPTNARDPDFGKEINSNPLILFKKNKKEFKERFINLPLTKEIIIKENGLIEDDHCIEELLHHVEYNVEKK